MSAVTGWPLCLAEIVLYTVMSGLVIAMVLDARDRFRELRERRDADDPEEDDTPDQEDRSEVSTVRRRPGGEPPDTDPPPLAS